MPRKLKVFRTPTGFHDAYVAAPSRKAALAAWGSDADLFARGVAEEITDPQLMAEPLEHPGKVIKLSRGDLAAQLKALGPRKKARKQGSSTKIEDSAEDTAEEKTAPRSRPTPPKPPPKRDKVDAAEAALKEARRAQASETKTLEAEREAIERKLDALRVRHERDLQRLERARDKAREAYQAALDRWTE
jgi:chromosome segregation ATPase